MRKTLLLAAVLLLPQPLAALTTGLSVAPDGAVLAGSPVRLVVTVEDPPTRTLRVAVFEDGKQRASLDLAAGENRVELPDLSLDAGHHTIALRSGTISAETRFLALPGWLSIAPPLIAIALALLFKDVLLALFLGVFSGALLLTGGDPIGAFARSADRYVKPALANPDHAAILIFSTLLGGMVGVISKSGGTQGIVDRLAPYARSARRGQLAAWIMGILIFFDDYANTLIVGSTMRPITDRLKVSREKLAYIVDSTAAPVASVFPISTWIGFEVGLIAAAFHQLGVPYNAYTTFVASIPYRFYPILALVLGLTLVWTRRDFGPMLTAERRAAASGKVVADGDVPLADYTTHALAPPDDVPRRAFNAFVPIATVVVVVIAGLFSTGSAAVERASYPSTLAWLREVFAHANSSDTLLWASLAGVVVAILLAVGQRLLTSRQAIEALVEGFKSMLLAMVVLILAWSIGAVAGDLHTADYVVGLTQGVLSPHWLPVLVFAASAAISFATGTSWGTMAILMPLVIPIAHGLSIGAGHPVQSHTYYVFMLGTISSVLAGSVWGDHCSPISDTTILSSMASGCDHIAHVRTQLPYALAIGLLGMAVGDIPTAFGLSPWVSILVGAAVITGGVLWLGGRSDASPPPLPAPAGAPPETPAAPAATASEAS